MTHIAACPSPLLCAHAPLPSRPATQVAETGPNVKGNTAAGGSKPATLETGAVISVPLFIEIGEMIKVDSEKGIYLSRSSSSS